MQRNVIGANVVGDLGVVDDDGQRCGRQQHEEEHLQEFADDVAIDDVRKGDVEPRQDGAIVFFRRSLEQDPEYASSLARLGAAHSALGAYAEAFQCLDRALQVDPDYGWACGQRARVALATGRMSARAKTKSGG